MIPTSRPSRGGIVSRNLQAETNCFSDQEISYTKNGYTHNKIAEKVAKPSQLSEYRSESSILNPEQVEYIRFLKTFQEFSLKYSKIKVEKK